MVGKIGKSKLLGRPKELQEETERLTFHMEKSVAKALRTYVTKERKISAILRDAATEYLEKLHQEEAIDKLGDEWKEFVELYDRVKEFEEKPLDFTILVRAKKASKAFLDYIAADFERYKNTFPSDWFQPLSPLPEDKIMREAKIIIRELTEQYSKSTFDVFHRLFSYIVWSRDWNKRRKQFLDSLDETIKKMESMKPEQIPIPEIEIPEKTEE